MGVGSMSNFDAIEMLKAHGTDLLQAVDRIYHRRPVATTDCHATPLNSGRAAATQAVPGLHDRIAAQTSQRSCNPGYWSSGDHAGSEA